MSCLRKRWRSQKVLQHLRVIHLKSDFVNEKKKTFFSIPHSNFHGNELMSNEKCGKFSLVNDNQNGMVAHTNIQSAAGEKWMILFLTFFPRQNVLQLILWQQTTIKQNMEKYKTWYTIRWLHGVFIISIQMVLSSNNPLKYKPSVELSISLEFLLSHNRIKFLLSFSRIVKNSISQWRSNFNEVLDFSTRWRPRAMYLFLKAAWEHELYDQEHTNKIHLCPLLFWQLHCA